MAKKKTATKSNTKSKSKPHIPLSSAHAPKVGDMIPDFSLPSTEGEFRLSQYVGQKVVLFFYPKDATPGCTLEGHDFSRLKAQFKKAGSVVFGISRDSLASHEKFRAKEKYSVDLISDHEEKACQIFDVIKEKTMFGHVTMGIVRSTFLIGADGKLVEEWRQVSVPGHAEDVLAKVKGL